MECPECHHHTPAHPPLHCHQCGRILPTETCPAGTLDALLRLCNAAWEGNRSEIDKAIPAARAILDKAKD